MANLSESQIQPDQQEFETPHETFTFIQPQLPPKDIVNRDDSNNTNNEDPPSSELPHKNNNLSTTKSRRRGYKLFSEHSLQVIAEQTNLQMDLPLRVSKQISEDMSFRVRELIHRSAQFMHHSSRTKLTTDDVSKAMQEMDCDTIFGHNNSQKTWSSLKYRYVPLASVYIREDPTVDLRVVASKIIANRCDKTADKFTATAASSSSSTFTIEWPQEKQFICDNSVCTTNDSTQRTTKLEKYFTQLSVTISNINCTMFAHLSASEKSLLLNLMFFDLSRNVNLKPVLHRFISFAMHALRTLQRFSSRANIDPLVFSQTKLESYHIYLRTIRALMSNQHFSHWALHSDSICRLAEVLLSLSFDLRLCGDLSLLYHQSLHIRSQFARLYGQILSKFCLPFSDLQNQLISLLYDKIGEYQKSRSNLSWTERAAIDYSILLLHRYMGFDVCMRFLLPLLLKRQNVFFEEYFTETVHHKTQSKVQATLQDVAGTAVRGEICLIGELVMKGIALLLVQVADDTVSIDNSNQIYGFFSERFGSSLAARLCPLPELATSKNTRQAWDRSWRTRLAQKEMTKGLIEGNEMQSRTSATVATVTPSVTTRTRTESTSNSKSDNPTTETSPTNKNRKRKGTGLLESMLSTDTSMLAKNESLSMFTESLLEASHRQYDKKKPTRVFMFSDEYNRFEQIAPELAAAINSRIVFDGKRLYSRAEPTEPDLHVTIKSRLTYPDEPSPWHTLYLKAYKPAKRAHLPGHTGTFPPDWKIDEEILQMEVDLLDFSSEQENLEPTETNKDAKSQSIVKEETAKKAEAAPAIKKSIRRQSHIFHYHRRKQHLRSNFSLFTQL